MSIRRRLILHFCVVLFLAGMCVSEAYAGARSVADYPLRVHIYDKHQSHNARWNYYHGHGRGNVMDGNEVNGMEYSFECTYSFLDSEADEDYPARWKKQGLSLEILMGVIGSDTSTRTCELKVALKEYAFAKINGSLVQISPEEFFERQSARAERAAALAPSDTDPSHYPEELSLLNLTWTSSVSGLHSGTGQGDLKTPAGLEAVDFAIRCPVVIQTTPEGRYYRGRWTAPGHQMVLLLGNLADPGAAATCELTTVVHADVYVRQAAGMIKAVSRDEYAQMSKTGGR